MTNANLRTANLPIVDEFGGRFPNAVVTVEMVDGASRLRTESVGCIADYTRKHEVNEIAYRAMYRYDPSQVNMTLRQLKEMRHITRYYDADGEEITAKEAGDLKIEAAKNGDNTAEYFTEKTSFEATKDLYVDLDDPAVEAAMQGQADTEELLIRAVFADLQRRAKQ